MADQTYPGSNSPGTDPSLSSPTPPIDGGSNNVRIVLMAAAVLLVGFFLYREVAVEGAGGGGGSAADYGWKVVAPDGSPVDLASYKGRPVLLNVWATWCPPCMMEMPSLIALSQDPELKEADVAVLLVSTDGDLEPVRQFLARTDTGNAEVVMAAEMPPEVFSTAGIPATFLIAPDGTIVRKEVGAMDWNTPEVVSELVALSKKS
jgi:thiol-disulfide isomerase/thioredoxin